MSDTVSEEKLMNAIANLRNLAKSGNTSTTAAPAMVGESSPTQVYTGSNSAVSSWAGSTWRGEGWEDAIAENGTDYNGVRKVGKSVAKSIMDKLAKGTELTARELNFVSKGGLAFLNDDKDEKDEKGAKDAKGDKDAKDVAKAQKDDHDDEEDDKKLINDMVKPSARKADVAKSFADYAAESTELAQGIEISPFLAEFAAAINKSLASMEARLKDSMISIVCAATEDTAAVQKSMSDSLAALGEVLAVHTQRIDQIESTPVAAPKSAQMHKSAAGAAEQPQMSKSQISEALTDLVIKSQIPVEAVLKFDATGEISPELLRKVQAR